VIDQDALRGRLLEIADDHGRLAFTRHLASSALRDLSDFPEVPDLTDETLLEALRQRVLARADRPGRPDDLAGTASPPGAVMSAFSHEDARAALDQFVAAVEADLSSDGDWPHMVCLVRAQFEPDCTFESAEQAYIAVAAILAEAVGRLARPTKDGVR
jgi:hypothetical protein